MSLSYQYKSTARVAIAEARALLDNLEELILSHDALFYQQYPESLNQEKLEQAIRNIHKCAVGRYAAVSKLVGKVKVWE